MPSSSVCAPTNKCVSGTSNGASKELKMRSRQQHSWPRSISMFFESLFFWIFRSRDIDIRVARLRQHSIGAWCIYCIFHQQTPMTAVLAYRHLFFFNFLRKILRNLTTAANLFALLIKFLSFYYHFCGNDSQFEKYYKKSKICFILFLMW